MSDRIAGVFGAQKKFKNCHDHFFLLRVTYSKYARKITRRLHIHVQFLLDWRRNVRRSLRLIGHVFAAETASNTRK